MFGGTLVLCILVIVAQIEGHGRLIEPPSRSTMWRYGFNTPPNYNDHELYCGGFTRQWQSNAGKCGICGDPWDSPRPRSNEAMGTYGLGVIARKYRKDQSIKVRVELTANHMGHFEFRICPNNSPRKPASQKCLDRFILEQADGSGPSYPPGPGNKVFEMQYQLPKGLTCTQCVFQWRYIAGNNWGSCKNGSSAVGCGPQEEFRACADITITEHDGTADNTSNTDKDTPWKSHDDNKNEVEFESTNSVKKTWKEDDIEGTVATERVVIVVLASLLFAVVMFGVVFLYYYRCRHMVKDFMDDRDISLPSLPNMPKFSKVKFPKVKVPKVRQFKSIKVGRLCNLDKLGRINWPLSNISLSNNNLPSFINKTHGVVTVSGVTSAPPTSHPPVPPPRLKKARSESPEKASNHYASSNIMKAAPRLATITPRPHTNRPPAPPPLGPPSKPTCPVLEISSPTSVTINGVTVAATSPVPPPVAPNIKKHSQSSNSSSTSKSSSTGPHQSNSKSSSIGPQQSSSKPSSIGPQQSSAGVIPLTGLPKAVTVPPKAMPRPNHDGIVGPRPSSEGVICSALPAIVLADMPDSMEYSNSARDMEIVGHPCADRPATIILEDVPPPLPSCPPPDSFQESNETDA